MRLEAGLDSGDDRPPEWGLALLRSPQNGGKLRADGKRLIDSNGLQKGRIERGVVRFPLDPSDEGTVHYRAIGGAHFHERAGIPFAMSALDTPVYHEFLRAVTPRTTEGIVVDVGGGDGRNAAPWLEQGYRVVVIDVVADALIRFRERVRSERPEWLDRMLLVEADARSLPLAGECVDAVIAIESLYYLNEAYERGLDECIRVLAAGGKLLLSERDYEGTLIMLALYQGLPAMIQTAGTRSVRDGHGENMVRSRCFTESELVALLEARNLSVLEVRGTALLACILGWMRNNERISGSDLTLLPQVRSLLAELGKEGAIRRCHVAVALKGPS